MPLLWAGSFLGTVRLLLARPARLIIAIGLPAGTIAAILKGSDWPVFAALGTAWLALVVVIAIRSTKGRLIIGQFETASGSGTNGGSASLFGVDVADLLRVEIAQFADLFHVVDARRAVSSGLAVESRLSGPGEPGQMAATSGLMEHSVLDATLSVDELSESLQGPISGEAKINLGPLTISLAPFIQLVGRLLQSPRLTGHLHQDGDCLILTAQVTRDRNISWRVESDGVGSANSQRSAAGEADSLQRTTNSGQPTVAAMVRELALQIYTDLALDRTVRWEATKHFVAGLRRLRACMGTPRDRKVNLRAAERSLLETLAEDEDFPSACYNLGVLYTELLGLAIAAGRNTEAELHRSAAETSFGRAIEHAPRRWDSHFAFAQIQLSYGRYEAVEELCSYMGQRKPTLTQELRTRELGARALLSAERTSEALNEARTASALAFIELTWARMRRRSPLSSRDERASASARTAAACLQTYGACYLPSQPTADHGSNRGRALRKIQRQMRTLVRLSRLGDSRAALQHYFGHWALKKKHWQLAEAQLREAAGSLPTRAAFAADLALARAKHLAEQSGNDAIGEISDQERDVILSPARRALQAMAGTFSPTHDARVCETVASVYRLLAGSNLDPSEAPAAGDCKDARLARELGEVATKIEEALTDQTMSASGIFIRMSQIAGGELLELIGEYGQAAQRAYALLEEARRDRKEVEELYIDIAQTADARQRREEHERSAVESLREALIEAERATSLNPLSTFALETLGDIHAEFRDFGNARFAWTSALTTDPDNPELYEKLGSSYWNIAFEVRARPREEDLQEAVRHFRDALTLYARADPRRVRVHYRLAKLFSSLHELPVARRHLEIVSAAEASDRPPLVGWVMFGLACLEQRAFSECEHYFREVIAEGDRLAAPTDEDDHGLNPTKILGDSLDEKLWPFALVRAWGHLGLALSGLERDSDSGEIADHLDAADERLDEIYDTGDNPAVHKRFPTRARAAVIEARGRLLLPQDPRAAATMFEDAISQVPFSRTYLALASALEQLAQEVEVMENEAGAYRYRRRANSLVRNALSLGQWKEPPHEAQELRERLATAGG